jgi:dTMP kinase
MRFLPQPCISLLVDLPEKVAFSRKTDVPDVAYLQERRRYYLTLVDRAEVCLVDGELSPDELARQALSLLTAFGRG